MDTKLQLTNEHPKLKDKFAYEHLHDWNNIFGFEQWRI